MSLELTGNYIKAMPESLSLDSEVELSGIVSRVQSYVQAQPSSGYTSSQIITIPLPMETLQLQSATVQFTIAGTPSTTGTFTRFNKDIRSIFNRVVARIGSKIVYDSMNSNLLYNILTGAFPTAWATSTGAQTTGTGSAVQRNADFLNANKVYAVQLYTSQESFFYNLFPLMYLGAQMYIDLYLENPAVCIETDGLPNANYVVNNVEFHYATCVMSEGYKNMYKEKIPKGISYTYFNYANLFDSSLLPAGTTKASKVLSFKYSSLIGVLCVMQDQNTTQTTLNKLNKFNFNNLNYAVVRVGSQNMPNEMKRNTSDMLSMYAELTGISMRTDFAQAVNFDSDNFVLAIPLARQIKELENKDKRVSYSGINTSLGTSLVLELGFSSALVSNQTLQIFGIYESTLVYQPNGSVIYYD